MGVKYVKDFVFPSSGGFHGDVQRYAKGGHVTKMPAKAKASAKGVPARAKPNAPAKGAPKMASKPAVGKRQGYDKGGRVPGREMDRLPTKRPPGRMKDLAPARRFKGEYEGYAEGGPVAEILPGDGMAPPSPMTPMPVKNFVMPPPGKGPDMGYKGGLEAVPMPEKMLRDPTGMTYVKPMWEKLGMTREEYLNQAGRPAGMDSPAPKGDRYGGILETVPTVPLAGDDGKSVDFLRQLLQRDTQRMRGDAAQQMRDISALEAAPPMQLGGDQYPIGAPMPVGALTPIPEEPQYDILPELPPELRGPPKRVPASRAMTPIPAEPVYARPAPYTGPTIAEEDPNFYRRAMANTQRAMQQPPMLERLITPEMQPGYIRPRADNIPPVPVAPPAPAPRMKGPATAARRAALEKVMGMREDMGRRPAAAPAPKGLRNALLRALASRMRAPAPVSRARSEVLPVNPAALPAFKKGGEVKGKKIAKVMGEYKRGELHSGSKKGPKVTNEKQAMAIALSEARKAGAKIPKKAEGGIFNNEDMAYESKGPKTRYSAARSRRESKQRAMERRALDKARHAEKYAPGMSLDMPDRKKHGGMPVHRRKPMYGGGKC